LIASLGLGTCMQVFRLMLMSVNILINVYTDNSNEEVKIVDHS